jgi:hypothetical protein
MYDFINTLKLKRSHSYIFPEPQFIVSHSCPPLSSYAKTKWTKLDFKKIAIHPIFASVVSIIFIKKKKK